jgi:hypothetical protein
MREFLLARARLQKRLALWRVATGILVVIALGTLGLGQLSPANKANAWTVCFIAVVMMLYGGHRQRYYEQRLGKR